MSRSISLFVTRRSLGRSIGVAMVLGLLAFVVYDGLDDRGYLRHEDRFRASSYGIRYWTSSELPGVVRRDRAWARAHPAAMLAAGDEACHWLHHQPDSPQDGSLEDGTYDRFGPDTVVRRYLRGHHLRGIALHGLSRYDLVSSAWQSLCGHTYRQKTAWYIDPDGPLG